MTDWTSARPPSGSTGAATARAASPLGGPRSTFLRGAPLWERPEEMSIIAWIKQHTVPDPVVAVSNITLRAGGTAVERQILLDMPGQRPIFMALGYWEQTFCGLPEGTRIVMLVINLSSQEDMVTAEIVDQDADKTVAADSSTRIARAECRVGQ